MAKKENYQGTIISNSCVAKLKIKRIHIRSISLIMEIFIIFNVTDRTTDIRIWTSHQAWEILVLKQNYPVSKKYESVGLGVFCSIKWSDSMLGVS